MTGSISIKWNELLINAITWTDFKNITLSERTQSQKTTYHVILFTWNRQIYRNRKEIKVERKKGRQGVEIGSDSNEYKISFLMMKIS